MIPKNEKNGFTINMNKKNYLIIKLKSYHNFLIKKTPILDYFGLLSKIREHIRVAILNRVVILTQENGFFVFVILLSLYSILEHFMGGGTPGSCDIFSSGANQQFKQRRSNHESRCYFTLTVGNDVRTKIIDDYRNLIGPINEQKTEIIVSKILEFIGTALPTVRHILL